MEFPDEESVAVVCSNWLSEENSKCHWPSALGSKPKKFIQERVQLGTDLKVQWSTYPCRVLFV